MSTHVLEARGITKRFGGFTALDAVDFVVSPGERVGLIGPNGSGKSTLTNCLTGTLRADAGNVLFNDRDVTGLRAWERARLGLCRSFQIPRPFRGLTVGENVEIPLLFARPPNSQLAGTAAREEAEALLERVGLGARTYASPASLSQVELRRLELARALAASPRLLVADEAMAGLSDGESDEILDLLLVVNAGGIAVVLIEHIMHAVVRFSQRICVLVAGRKIADGDPQAVLAHPEVERAYLG